MNFNATAILLFLAACTPTSKSPQVQVIDVTPSVNYSLPPVDKNSVGCNMQELIDTVTEQCCPQACTRKGYSYKIHLACASDIILRTNCTLRDLKDTSKGKYISICVCDPIEETWQTP